MPHLSQEQVRDIDRRAIDEFGLPGVVLMENAGRGAATAIQQHFPTGAVAILCGKGNNAGDGYVIARHLELMGRTVTLLTAVEPQSLTGDALINATVAKRAGIPITTLGNACLADWQAAVEPAAVLVDALLGTGASGAPRGNLATAITAINAAKTQRPSTAVVAIDLPSGLDCDSGIAPGDCVQADLTVTFVAAKQGFSNAAAQPLLGTVEVVSIGAPACLLRSAGLITAKAASRSRTHAGRL